MTLYREDIIELAKNPLNRREISHADITHSGLNPLCGDHVRIYLQIDRDGTIHDASFMGDGCAISIAAASLLTDELKGKKITDIENLQTKNMLELLGLDLGPSRIKCAVLVLETIKEGMLKDRSS
ncbi:MAG: iron-sulfur cluster assembly scaffold protein [Patescibacteria group bacterium]